MAFEFLGTALRGATDILGGLVGEVGNGRANGEDDVLKAKRAFGALGRYEEPEDGANGIIDRPLDTAIRGFQRDKGLRVDGFMRPDGPTQRSLQDDVLGFLKREGDEVDKDRSSRSDRFRPRSLNPAASLLEERDSPLNRFDLDDRGGPFSLLEADERGPLARRNLSFRPDRDDVEADDRLLRRASDEVAPPTREFRPDRGGSIHNRQRRAEKPTADAAPKEPEPASLTPALDKIEKNLWRTVEGWREQGMTDAAGHLAHFLKGSGEPIIYNRDQARSFGPVRNAEEDAQRLIREWVLAEARKLKDGESREITETVTGEHGLLGHGLDLVRGLFGDTDRFNDNLATGRTTVRSTFKGRIGRKRGRDFGRRDRRP